MHNTSTILHRGKKAPMPEEQKIAEGIFLREQWDAYKAQHPGMTQEKLSKRLGITQGLLQQVFRGTTGAPNWLLIELGITFGLDPSHVRKDIALLADRLTLAMNGSVESANSQRFKALPDEIQRECLNYAEYLCGKSEDDDSKDLPLFHL